MDSLRLDKWLWSVRIYKSRTIAISACKSGSIKINQNKAKPASTIKPEDHIIVHKNGFNLHFRVIKLIEKRVSASLAVECYEDLTPDAELNKYKEWFVGKSSPEYRAPGTGRPTKKERREIDDFKENYIYDFDE